MVIAMSPVLGGLFVFLLRVFDMSLDTLRLSFVVKGHKIFAGLIGSLQATIYILAISAVIRGPLDPWTVAGYAAGVGAGIWLGMVLEPHIKPSYSMLAIYSPSRGHHIAARLREAGYAATEYLANGMNGPMTTINCVINSREIVSVRKVIELEDPTAFVIVEQIRSMWRGFIRR
jgi:uncharacterized protein YebE (UPF0316 family)